VSLQIPSAAECGGARSILDAATRLFADEGFEPVSVARIAETAGVCKANVFHHFASKEALFLAVMEQASGEHAERAEALLHEPGPSALKVRRLLAFEIELMIDHGARTRLLLRECWDFGHPRARELAQQVFRRNFHAVTALFEQGRASGEFRADLDPAAATLLLIATKQFFMQQRAALRASPDVREFSDPSVYVDRICSIVLDGVVARRAPRPVAAAGERRRRRRSGAQTS